jgi:hypothetical protein
VNTGGLRREGGAQPKRTPSGFSQVMPTHRSCCPMSSAPYATAGALDKPLMRLGNLETFHIRVEPYVTPKTSLTGSSSERVNRP